MVSYATLDEDDTTIVSLLRPKTASQEERVVPVSAILFDDTTIEPTSVPAKKVRKKRAKRVNWVYVVENSIDILHVADFTIAATAEPQTASDIGVPSSSAEMSVVEPSKEIAERVSCGATSIPRKKRAKRVNWEYVVENGTDVLSEF
jgi:hypothetical protein